MITIALIGEHNLKKKRKKNCSNRGAMEGECVASVDETYRDLLANCLRPVQAQATESTFSAGGEGLDLLPDPALERVVGHLGVKDFHAFASTCRGIYARLQETAPGLESPPYPHQRAALAWMKRREKEGAQGGVGACRGGMLCEAPGMGKTLAVLALILATQGKRPHPESEPTASGEGESESGRKARRRSSQFSPGAFAAMSEGREQWRRLSAEGCKGMVNAATTILIMPSLLIDHWLQEIRQHLSLGTLRVAVVDDGKQKNRTPCTSVNHLAHKQASAECLASHDAIIVSDSVLSASFADPDSPLRRVRFLRKVVDEGHRMGSLHITSRGRFAACIEAERKWIVTGTPTPHELRLQVAHLQPLLEFLDEPVYGRDAERYKVDILGPLKDADAQLQHEGKARLAHLLRAVMARSSKVQVHLPAVHKREKLLDFDEAHARRYNELAEHLHRNLLLADWLDPNHSQSLLNPQNAGEASKAATNLREACCISGEIPGLF